MGNDGPAAEGCINQGIANVRVNGPAVDDEAAFGGHALSIRLFLNDQSHRARMTCMPRLGMVEHGDPDIERASSNEVLVVLASGPHCTAGDKRPVSILPMSRS